MIAALVAMPIVSGKMNAAVKKEIDTRGKKFGELARLEKTQVTAPSATGGGESRPVLVNQKLLDRYEQIVTSLREDAAQVKTVALEHNRKSRNVVLGTMFPAPPPAQAQVLPLQFWERLVEAYDQLLEDVGAGQPPTEEEVAQLLQRRQAQFITQIAAKDSVEDLTEEEREQLMTVLTNERLTQYTLAAEHIGMYADFPAVSVPGWDPGRIPSVPELFNWQWTYWIIEDVLRALNTADPEGTSVLRAKVKRILWVQPRAMPQGSDAPPPTNRGRSAGRGGAFGGGGRTAGGAAGASLGGSNRGNAGNPRPSGPDFSSSFTGRKSNALYDVILVDVGMLVESGEIPAVLDAIARYNFVTILDCRITPVDPYEDLEQGFFYGTSPLSQVELTLETVWLREWTTPFMPDGTKRGLGIAVKDDNAAGNNKAR
jgi:hypothetical protein